MTKRRHREQNTERSPVSKHDKWMIPQKILREVRWHESVTNARQKRVSGISAKHYIHRSWGCGCCVTISEAKPRETTEQPPKKTRPRRKQYSYETNGQFTRPFDAFGKPLPC